MRALELKLLGDFDCTLGKDERISLSMRKAEVLLAYLALAPGLRHPRERLINLLWSDRSEEQARNSLRQCLSTIRKSLGDSADLILQVDRTTVSLKPELIEVDVHEFERLAMAGDFESLTTATELYLGEFLEGISIRDASCQDWLDSERNRFKRQFIELLTNLAETLLVTHDFSAAIRAGERLVEQDPLNEAGWRLLMRSYHENDDRNHALLTFRRCSEVLQKELGVDPEASTIELQNQIKQGLKGSTEIPSQAVVESAKVSPPSPPTGKIHENSIVVLPFDNLSGDPEQEYFSDGITDSIILHLGSFPGLKVKSRNSSFAFKQQIKSLGEISDELKVDYLVEGSIRKSDQRIRITVQLIEAHNGNQLWGKRYEGELDRLFDLEEELSRSIAATVTGKIESELQRIALAKGAADQQAYDLLLSGTYHYRKFTGPDTRIAIDQLNRCLQLDPENVLAHAWLYYCHAMNWMERWVEDFEASLELSRQHARKAFELGPENGAALVAYAEYLIFLNEPENAAKYIDKALAINPNDPDAHAMHSLKLLFLCRFPEALEAASTGCALDPYHHWCDWCLGESQFFCGQYEAALETIASSNNAPGYIRIYAIAAYLELGKQDQAEKALQEFLSAAQRDMAVMPRNKEEWIKYSLDNAPSIDASVNERLIEYLVRAGLDKELTKIASAVSANQQPSILVLPFENMSGDPEQEYFSDGITASLILNLGLFNGLKIKSQNSSFAFKNSSSSSAEIAEALNVDFLIEGSMRKSGNKIRLSVQLVESASDTQVWGKQYNAELEDILDLEQELSQTIAATISGRIGHKIQQAAVHKPAKDLKSYDHLLSGLYHIGKFTPQDMLVAREHIEKCIESDPNNVLAHSNLGVIGTIELIEAWASEREQTAKTADRHYQIALEIDPDNAITHAFMSTHQLYFGDYEKSEFHADLSMQLNPSASEGYVAKADLLTRLGRIDEALKFADQSLHLDPHSIGAGWVAGDAYLIAGQYEKALKILRSISHPSTSVQALVAACLAGLGRIDEAKATMKQYRQVVREQMSDYPHSERAWRRHWGGYSNFASTETFEPYFELLLKAGLCDDEIEASDSQPSIAVLPFENMSGDAEQEHFSDGITTDIIAILSRFKHLRTIARHSTLQYKDQKASIAEIAAQQKVRFILEGSVRKSGDRIRVSAELIDAQNGTACWNDRYDRKLDDLFAVQDEIAKSIALAMKVHLDDGAMALHRSTGTSNIKAWELVLAAVDLQDTYIRKNILEARSMALEAIRLDPRYPYAWISLGWTYWQEIYSGFGESIEELLAEAESACNKAFEILPDYSEAWSLKAMIHVMKHQPEQAIEACQKAAELEPGNAEIQALMAFAYLFVGDFDRAGKHRQNMVQLCPVLPNWYYLLEGEIHRQGGDLTAALQFFQKGVDVEADSPLCRFYLIDTLMQKGDSENARKIADQIKALDRTVTGKGLIHVTSFDEARRESFRSNLDHFGLAG